MKKKGRGGRRRGGEGERKKRRTGGEEDIPVCGNKRVHGSAYTGSSSLCYTLHKKGILEKQYIIIMYTPALMALHPC